VDLPTVVSAASLVNNAISSLKSVRELAKDTADTKLKEQISDVYDVLLDLKERTHAQDDEIRLLKAQLAAKSAYCGPIAPHGYFYFDTDEKNDNEPLCPVCFQATPQQISFMGEREDWNGGVRRRCKLNRSHIIYEQEMEWDA
jgi:hypothetical protein